MNEEDLNESAESEMAYYDEVAKAAAAWKTKWPGHCTKCGGWGEFFSPGKYSGPPEDCYPDDCDPCEALPDGACHRCGKLQAVPIDSDSSVIQPCRFCGWCYNDGVPTP
jgi:hypothetical protein